MRELNVANGRLFGLEDLGHNIDDVLNVADRELKAAGLYEAYIAFLSDDVIDDVVAAKVAEVLNKVANNF